MNKCIVRTKRAVAALLVLLTLLTLVLTGCNDNTVGQPTPPSVFEEHDDNTVSQPTQPSAGDEDGSEVPISYPLWFFLAKWKEQPLTVSEKLKLIKLGMSYAEVSEILGGKGKETEEFLVYEWELDGGDLLKIAFSHPTWLIRYEYPGDLVLKNMRIVPAEEGAPVRYSIYVHRKDTVESILSSFYGLHGFNDADIAKKAFEELDISNTDFWFKDLLPTVTNAPSYKRFEGYFLEGFYFYDSYEPTEEAYAEAVTNLLLDMLSYFDQKIGDDLLTTHQQHMQRYYPDYTPLYSLAEIVTMASLIESDIGEIREEYYYMTLAAEYHKRLNDEKTGGVICSPGSLTYGVWLAEGHFYVRVEEYLDYDSAYNTYKNKGLPPSPICVLSLDAIEAAVTLAQHAKR